MNFLLPELAHQLMKAKKEKTSLKNFSANPLDLQIQQLQELMFDGQERSTQDMATQLHTTTKTIRYAVTKLQRQGQLVCVRKDFYNGTLMNIWQMPRR